MKDAIPSPVLLRDYQAPSYRIVRTDLTFRLEPESTWVHARLALSRLTPMASTLFLHGEGLELLSIKLDGQDLSSDQYHVSDEGLTLMGLGEHGVLETEVRINPKANLALEGLYMSGGRFCTQCEAEGFRKITYFLDRPDALSVFQVRLEADQALYPHLLSNGNLVDHGPLAEGRHFALWHDPFPKPAYLFAIVAGTLDVLDDQFTTASGRDIALKIFVDPGQSGRAHYAMDALKRAMRWDEQVYGREYDLDLFMIVAVRDFNFGAMENKGLNIFNSSLLLADPHTATDLDYERIEGVVAHEYFHNWSGNRVTCQNWFQLCLKEGFTVFRDQGFSGSQRGEAVQRIKDVRALRARQFPEDQGPLAHAVRPDSYVKIDNFYTATIYEKGAEIVGMIKALLGDDLFRKGSDLYFDRHDGTAARLEDFIAAFADVSQRDLSQFFRWYQQPGTPALKISPRYDADQKTLTLEITQTQDHPDSRAPLLIPVRLGLLSATGQALGFALAKDAPQVQETLLEVTDSHQSFVLYDVSEPPILSALRGFSAPVRLILNEAASADYVRLAHDTDLFNRWEASQNLAKTLILNRAQGQPEPDHERAFVTALGQAIKDSGSSTAFRALVLSLPSEMDLLQAMTPADPAPLHHARTHLRALIGQTLGADLGALHSQLEHQGPFSDAPEAAGDRALRNAALDLLVAGAIGPQKSADPLLSDLKSRTLAHIQKATNLTEELSGLSTLLTFDDQDADAALARFYDRWSKEPLVLDKWFAVQARHPSPRTLARIVTLVRHPDFDAKTPNRFRAVSQAFASLNPVCFHDVSGAGYRFIADQILMVDRFNPMMAARLVEVFSGWKRMQPALGQMMQAELRRILGAPGLSKNVLELALKALD